MATIPTLAPGASKQFTVVYKAKESDMGRTDLIETVTAQSGTTKASGSSAAAKMEDVRYGLDATKTLANSPADGEAFTEGETAQWNVSMTNTGNQTLQNVKITEKLSGATITGGDTVASIAPKAIAVKQATYAIKDSDLGREDLRNVVDIAASNGGVAKSNVYSPFLIIDAGFEGYFAYLYDGNNLHFSNKRINNHGLKILTSSWEIPEQGYKYMDDVPWIEYKDRIKTITSNKFKAPLKIGSFFSSCSNLSDISDLSKWVTSNVEDMYYLFYNCSNLSDISPLSGWVTSNVTDMSCMFRDCSNLSDISPLSGWVTSNVTNTMYFFSNCSNLSDISPLSGWVTSSGSDMRFFFENTNIYDVSPLSGWVTSSFVNMSGMFKNCNKVSTFEPINSWNVSNVSAKGLCFSGTTGTLPSWATPASAWGR